MDIEDINKIREQRIAAADKEVEAICDIVKNGIKLLNRIAPGTYAQKKDVDERADAAATLAELIAKLVNRA